MGQGRRSMPFGPDDAAEVDVALRRLMQPALLEPVPHGWVTLIWQNHASNRRDESNRDSEPTDK
jgi:hypothetical protein